MVIWLLCALIITNRLCIVQDVLFTIWTYWRRNRTNYEHCSELNKVTKQLAGNKPSTCMSEYKIKELESSL